MTGKDIQILRDLRSTCSDERIKNAINEALFVQTTSRSRRARTI